MNKYIKKFFLLNQIKSFENINFYIQLEKHIDTINVDIFDMFISNMPKTIQKVHKKSIRSCFKLGYGPALIENSLLLTMLSAWIVVWNYQLYCVVFIIPLCYIAICLILGFVSIAKKKKNTIEQLINIYESIYQQLEIPAVDCYALLK